MRFLGFGVLWLGVLISCGSETKSPADDGPCVGCDAGRGGSVAGKGGAANASGGTQSGSGGSTASGGNGGVANGGSAGSIPLDTNVDPSVTQKLHSNQIGYDAQAPKRAVIEATGTLKTFQIVRDSDQRVMFAGELADVGNFTEWGGGPKFYVADFTGLAEPGNYKLYVNGQFSEAFEIGGRLLLSRTLEAVLAYFKASRADDPDVWAADQNVQFFGSTETRDVRGGWYDASGDISKYLSHLSYANFMNPQQTPLVAWALAWVYDHGASVIDANTQSALKAEALHGADYLRRVLDPEGFFYATVFDRWTGTLAERRICSYETDAGTMTAEYQAAYREGGGLSIAALARIASWQSAGAFSAAEYLSAAKLGFQHLEENGAKYADDGKENIIDDYAALLAASELYAGTKESGYLDAARKRAAALSARLHADGYFIADAGSRPFWHGSDAGLPLVALARYVEIETDASRRNAVSAAMRKHLDYLVSVTSGVPNPYSYARQHFNSGGGVKSGFFIPHDNETGYWWQGENARLGSLAAAALIAGRKVHADGPVLGVPHEIAAFAVSQLDWVLGNNPYDISFLNGFGRNNPPPYCNDKKQNGTLRGGIANGITGNGGDGSGILWRQTSDPGTCWELWRHVEQWLPHSTWFMLGVTALALGESP